MSFIDPGSSARGVSPQFEAEREREREAKLEAKAARYAALHTDGPDAPPRGLRARLRRLFKKSD
jgi:hypothetical protein